MKTLKQKIEILAPAGNMDSLKAAVNNGADAVYLGYSNFNARAKANNFNEENLLEAVNFAHLFGVKVYATFNTLIKNEEMESALKAVEFANACNVDAIIVQDLGFLTQISSTMPHITLHASTQMGVHNLSGARFLESLGVKRVILSRETTLADIKKISSETNLELEFFVQGALCVAFSGNCYFSSLVSSYSGNRGKCLQLCRKKYTLIKDNDCNNSNCESYGIKHNNAQDISPKNHEKQSDFTRKSNKKQSNVKVQNYDNQSFFAVKDNENKSNFAIQNYEKQKNFAAKVNDKQSNASVQSHENQNNFTVQNHENQSDFTRKSGYFLSAKDLCLLDNLRDLIDAGVISFKIEGRMRSPEYVAETVRVYKSTVNEILSKELVSKELLLNDCEVFSSSKKLDSLKTVFNRGDYCTSHLYPNSAGNIIYPKLQNNMGLFVGKVSSVKNGLARLSLVKKIDSGDGVKYLRNGEEVGAGLITNDNNTTTFKGDVQSGDEIRLTSDKSLMQKVANQESFLPIEIEARFKIGQPAQIKLTLPKCKISSTDETLIESLVSVFKEEEEGINVEYSGESNVLIAQKQPLTKSNIAANLSKFGGTVFNVKNINIKMDENIFYPVSALNALRRGAQDLLVQKIFENYKINQENYLTNLNQSQLSHNMRDITRNNYKLNDKNNTFVQIDNINNITEKLLCADYVIYNPAIYDINPIIEFNKICGNKAILNLPLIARNEDIELIKNIIDNSGIEIFIANNLYALDLLKNKFWIAGSGLNQLNDFLKISKINSIESEKYSYSSNNILYAFGHQVFMTFCHCPNREFNDCKTCRGNNLILQDETKNQFILRRVKEKSCYWQLVNTIPLDLISETRKMLHKNILLDFTLMESTQINSVMQNVFFDIKDNGYQEQNKRHMHGNFGKILY